jgi:hypothetical protein
MEAVDITWRIEDCNTVVTQIKYRLINTINDVSSYIRQFVDINPNLWLDADE